MNDNNIPNHLKVYIIDQDYNNYSIKFPNAGNPPNVDGVYYGEQISEDDDEVDCRGHWRLDMTDERFDYVKDNDELLEKTGINQS